MAEEVFELQGIYSIDSDQIESAIDDVNERIEELMESMGSLGDVTDEIFVTAGEQAEAFNDIIENTNNIGTDGVVSGLEEMSLVSEEVTDSVDNMEQAATQALEEMAAGAEDASIALEETGDAGSEAGEEISDSLDEASESASSLFDNISTGVAAVATAVASSAFIGAAEQQIASQIKLQDTLNRTNGLQEIQLNTLKAWASEIQFATGVGDEFTLLLASNLGAFASNEEALRGITEATIDYASSLTKKGLLPGQRELIKAQEQVKAALAGNINVLERTGIELTELEKEQFNNGTQAEKLALITELLNNRFSGLASTIFEASAEFGSFTALGGFVGDLFESVGQIMLLSLDPVVRLLSDGVLALTGWLDNVRELEGPMGKVVQTIITLGIVLVPTLATTKLFGAAMQQLGIQTLFSKFSLDAFKMSLDLATLGIAALVAIVVIALFQSEQFRNLLDRLVSVVMLLVETLLSALMPVFDLLIAILTPIIDLLVVMIDVALVPLITVFDILIAVLGPLIDIFGVLMEANMIPLMLLFALLTPLIELLTDALLFLTDFVVNKVMIPAFNLLLEVINKVIEGINFLIESANKIPGIDIELVEEIPEIEPIVVMREENIDTSEVEDVEVTAAVIPEIDQEEVAGLQLPVPTEIEEISAMAAVGTTTPETTGDIFDRDKCECPPTTLDNSITVNNPNQLDTLTSIEKARNTQRLNALFTFDN